MCIGCPRNEAMSESTQAILQRAYELIEIDELEQARALLTPLLETDAEDPSLWWVYAHALRDRSLGQMALDRVLALDPQYPGAAELKGDLDALAAQDEALLGADPNAEPVALSAADAEIDDWEDLQASLPVESEAGRSRWAFIALLALLLIVATGGALVATGLVDLSGLLGAILPTSQAPIVVVTTSTAEPSATLMTTPMETASPSQPAPSATAADEDPSQTPAISVTEDAPLPTEDAPAAPAATATDLQPEATEAGEPAPLPTDEAAPTNAADASDDPSPTPGLDLATQAPEAEATPTEQALDDAADDESEAQAIAPSLGIDASPTPAIPLSTLETYVILVEDGLSTVSIDRSLVLTRATELGHTLVLRTCAVPGSIEYQERLQEIMEAVVAVFPEIPFGIDAVAVGLINCDDPYAKLRVIGTSKAIIQQYANREITAKEFQSTWQPLS